MDEFLPGRVSYVQPLPASAQAWLAWCLWEAHRAPLLWVVDTPKTLDVFHRDLTVLGAGREEHVSYFPARESRPGRAGPPNADLAGDRLRTLQRCLDAEKPGIIATCVQALFQETPPPHLISRCAEPLAAGHEIDPDQLVRRLEEAGYAFEPEVQEKGRASRRGGLVDVWPPTEEWPVRLEFFGNVLESIRTFDPVEQRSLERLTSVMLAPADEMVLGYRLSVIGEEGEAPSNRQSAIGNRQFTDLLAYLPDRTIFAWSEPESIRHHAEVYRAMIPESDPAHDRARYDDLRLRASKAFQSPQLVIGLDSSQADPALELDFRPSEGLPALSGQVLHPDVLEEARRGLVKSLAGRAAAGQHVYFFFNTEGSRDRFLELYPLGETGRDRLHVGIGALSEGFLYEPAHLAVTAESDLYGLRKALPGRYEMRGKRAGPARAAGPRIAEWSDIQPGELVVHMDHGIGKYLGLYEIEFDGQDQEVLAIEYAEKAKLYVPVSQTHLLSRYVGIGRRRPDLHALGGKRWAREKIAAEKAVRDLASMLLDTQAQRDLLQGHAFGPDTPWQHEFEAAFPYQETDDQHRAIQETKQDMENHRPMDRLVCGDVGYGKTEVAMRAAFKAVMDGKQVAVLVPTTILAQQHFDTFTERISTYPFSIEMLSRFRTRAEQAAVARRIESGEVDIVIGTHRLLQRDIRFKDLGLVIIDEEQRFGVLHKEHLKHLKQLVDVLTLTATPIPRTLYMSLTGAKDMSTIQTPPQDRLPVETIVAQNTDEIVRRAVLHELNRGGQVFYLHNRVMTIQLVWERLKKLVPEARVEIGHGQMHEKELAAVMHRFVRGEFDVLLCTTIIESGVDIPNVNTILIDRADRFGMADLYQLRGRVGRYKHQAFAYFLLPRHGQLFDSARKRIGAIKRYSSLGAGFKLALRDLEIRGAGNLLGTEQSGHIAAVGFDLYCQLLKRTVARLKGEPVPPIIDVEAKLDFIDLSLEASREDRSAVIPPAYIEDENLRVSAYRKIAAAATEAEILEFCAEFRDRFGPVPPPLDRLLKVALLRIVAAGREIRSVEVRGDKVMMMRGTDYLTKSGRFPRLTSAGATARLDELLQLIRSGHGG